MNLASINTKTFDIRVYGSDRKVLGEAQFTRMLFLDELEQFRTDPKRFLAEIEWTNPAEKQVSNG